MKKMITVALALILILSCNAHAIGTMLPDINDKIFEESKAIQALFNESKDVLALSNMWSSCIVTVTQVGAYFYMVGIFNAIREEDLTYEAADYLKRWLGEIKKSNAKNIAALNLYSPQLVDARTIIHVEKMKLLYGDLNNIIDSELMGISLIETAHKLRPKTNRAQ